MTDARDILIQQARKVMDELEETWTDKDHAIPRKGMAYSLMQQVTQTEPEFAGDEYVTRFILDALHTIITKPWVKESEIPDRLPPYGFRNDDEIARWAYWFASHRKRTLSVNRFLQSIQGTDIKQSVFDMMYETFRYEQIAVAGKVIRFLRDGGSPD